MVFLSVQPKFRTAPAFPTVQNIKYATHKPFIFHVLNLRNFKTSDEIFTPIIQRSPCDVMCDFGGEHTLCPQIVPEIVILH